MLWNRNFTLLTISNFLICSAYYSLISTLPLYLSAVLETPHGMVGAVMASYAIAAILVRPFSGYSLDHFGRKSLFLASLLLYGLIFNAYIVASAVWIMIMVRLMHGLAWGLATSSNSTLAGDFIPADKRGRGFGYFGVTSTAGMAIGPLIGSFIQQHAGFQALFLSGSALGFISLALAAAIRYPAFRPVPHGRFRWDSLLEKRATTLSLNLMVIGLSYGGLISFVALFGKEIGIANPSGFFLVYAFGIIAARFTSGKAMDRRGPQYVLVTCLSLLVIGFPLLALVRNPAGFYLSAVILGVGNGVVWPTFQAMVNNIVTEQRRGGANATLFMAMDLGMSLGMIVTGQVAQHAGIPAAFLCCSLYAAAGLAIFLRFTLKSYQALNQAGRGNEV